METKISINNNNNYSIIKESNEQYRVITHLRDGRLISGARMFASLKEAYDALFLMTLQNQH